jgi:heme/copper-type cytochrome/quinol oxidase subunit 4
MTVWPLSMRSHVRLVATLAVGLIAYGVLIHAFHIMSQPSDRGWYGGIAIILGLLLLVPAIVREIWRRL